MPSKSPAQARLMAAACHGRARKKVSLSAACEFHRADVAKARAKRKGLK